MLNDSADDKLKNITNNLIKKWTAQYELDYRMKTTEGNGLKIELPNQFVCKMKKDKFSTGMRLWDYIRLEAVKYKIILYKENDGKIKI